MIYNTHFSISLYSNILFEYNSEVHHGHYAPQPWLFSMIVCLGLPHYPSPRQETGTSQKLRGGETGATKKFR